MEFLYSPEFQWAIRQYGLGEEEALQMLMEELQGAGPGESQTAWDQYQEYLGGLQEQGPAGGELRDLYSGLLDQGRPEYRNHSSELYDHLIVAAGGYTSLKERGVL